METQLVVGTSPHLREPDDISKIMWRVVAALAPAAAVSLYFFGWDALKAYAVSIAVAEATELACLRMRGKELRHAADGSAFITGMLLAMVLPPDCAWYCHVIGAAFAVAIAKHTFGGLGNNIWNPALAARVFLQFAYPAQVSMSLWTVPRRLWGAAADAATMASPLAREGASGSWSYLDLLFGNGVPGCLGETCKVALLAGGLFLILYRTIDWRVPVCYVATAFVLSWILPTGEDAPAWAADPVYHLLSGGLIIGAFFMATDMVTTPVTPMGRAVFGVGCGLVVAVIRRYGGYPEGVAYSIVLMNTFTPLIDRWVKPRMYGSRTPKPTPRKA
jgi:electron transport complex protein RnfD